MGRTLGVRGVLITSSQSLEQLLRRRKVHAPGVTVEEVFVDKGYQGKSHHPDGNKVLLSGCTRFPARLKGILRRRSSIEPIIGHSKHHHRPERNLIRGQLGDEMNPILAGAAFNLRKLLRSFLLRLLARFLEAKTEPEIFGLVSRRSII